MNLRRAVSFVSARRAEDKSDYRLRLEGISR